ncbi:MAG TPA: MoxR family ATPase [Candidatus Sulfotelmatobacter sp.]|nr:MoxR family ATPase [Candidatus Sulfotelmatobacter sp.]
MEQPSHLREVSASRDAVAADLVKAAENIREALGSVVSHEDPAVDAAIVSLMTQTPFGLGGRAATGKTLLSRAYFQAIEGVGYTNETVAFIPGDHDLSARAIKGDTYTQKKTTKSDIERTEEEITQEIAGIFTNKTRGIHFEEMTAANPAALRSAMSLMANGTVERRGEIQDMPGIHWVVASANTINRRDGTHTIPPQIASRMAVGTIMGLTDGTGDKSTRRARLLNRSTDKKEAWKKVDPVVSAKELLEFGRHIGQVAIPDEARDHIVELTISTMDVLAREFGVREGDHRMYEQLSLGARAQCAIHAGKMAVAKEDVVRALPGVFAARIFVHPKIDAEDFHQGQLNEFIETAISEAGK